ncbi:hypothetical protein GW17_00031618 [Ensete ventricosum]|nr:hypothetical protein GW17_00031618 [Ensete ventricosum]
MEMESHYYILFIYLVFAFTSLISTLITSSHKNILPTVLRQSSVLIIFDHRRPMSNHCTLRRSRADFSLSLFPCCCSRYSLYLTPLYMAGLSELTSWATGSTTVSGEGATTVAIDIRVLRPLMTARCSTLLCLPLVTICLHHNKLKFATRTSGVVCVLESLYYLHVIASVHEEGVGRGLDMNPFAAMLDLQAVDAVLVEEREKAVVGVGRETHGQLRLRTGRVEVGHTDLEACVEVQGVVHVALIEFQALPYPSE